MYHLAIDAHPPAESEHPNWAAAHSALVRYAATYDVYLSELPAAPGHTSYTLVTVADNRSRHPGAHAVGAAHIAATPGPTVCGAYYSASAAWNWIHDLTTVPPAVRAAVQLAHDGGGGYQLMSRALDLPALAGSPEAIDIPTHLREAALTAKLPTSPADLAAAVAVLMPTTATPQQTSAAIWWYALIAWGANT